MSQINEINNDKGNDKKEGVESQLRRIQDKL